MTMKDEKGLRAHLGSFEVVELEGDIFDAPENSVLIRESPFSFHVQRVVGMLQVHQQTAGADQWIRCIPLAYEVALLLALDYPLSLGMLPLRYPPLQMPSIVKVYGDVALQKHSKARFVKSSNLVSTYSASGTS